MCDRCRQRFLFVKNRLEELAWKYGPVMEPPPSAVDLAPTWGPVGSLAERLILEETLEELFRLHRDMLALERSRNPEQPSPSEPKGSSW